MRCRSKGLLIINAQCIDIDEKNVMLTLAEFLRQNLGLIGTKVVCAEGDCGACTVLLRKPFRKNYEPVNSCILTLGQLDGSSVVTIDAMSKDGDLTPVQSCMLKGHASQCGFCTPGFVMSLTGLVEEKISETKKSLSEREVKNALTGNLCRCTGYQPIIESACSIDLRKCHSVKDKFDKPSLDKELRGTWQKPLLISRRDVPVFFAPVSMKQAADFLKARKDFQIIGGASDLGVRHNKWHARLNFGLSLHLVKPLYEIRKVGNVLKVGACVTISEFRQTVKGLHPELYRYLDLFASPQIKNIATVAGNLVNASPIADIPPFLMISEAVIQVQSSNSKRRIPMSRFLLGYRKTSLKENEIVTSIEFSLPKSGETYFLKKISQRKDLDISTVNLGLKICQNRRGQIQRAVLSLGGVAPVTLRLEKTEKALLGPAQGAWARVCPILQSEINPISDLRGSQAFRRVLVSRLLKHCLDRVKA